MNLIFPVCIPSLEYIDLMETTQYMNEGELRGLADTYDSVYLHPVGMSTVRAEGGSHPGDSHPYSPPPPQGKQLRGQG